MLIVPALLETKSETLVGNVQRLSKFYRRFQIDIADGTFVPNTTIQISDFVQLLSQFPQGKLYDFHLMVQEPERHIETLHKIPHTVLGVVLIHKSVFPDHKQLTSTYPLTRFGLVLNPEDLVESLDDTTLKGLSAVQIMTVVPGFQGQSFIPDMLYKIEQLRKRGFSGEILIDGSVNDQTLPIIRKLHSPPDVLGIGSYLTKADDSTLSTRVAFMESQLIPRDKSDKK
jgi:ribulose-phosphate 3-epimerase